MDPKLLLDIVETLNVRSLEAILPQQIQGRIKEVVQYIFQYPDRHVQYLLKLLQAAFPELSDNDLPGIVNQMVAWVMQIRCKNPIGFQMMEGFCGQAHITKSCRKQGIFAVGLDVVHGDQFDVKTPQGCRRWLTTLFFCADGADQWHGVTCKSFVWLTRYVTKRSIDRPLGNEAIGIVQDGNELAVLVTFHVMLGALVRVDPILEQPQTSVLHLLPTVKRVFALLQVRKTITYLGAFGSPTKKPLKLYHVKTWPRHLTRPKPVGKRQQLATKNKSGGCNGDRKMLLFSSAYPIAFGEAVAKYVCEDLEQQQGCVQRSIEGTHRFSNGFFNNLFKSIREATLVEESKSIMWTKEARTALKTAFELHMNRLLGDAQTTARRVRKKSIVQPIDITNAQSRGVEGRLVDLFKKWEEKEDCEPLPESFQRISHYKLKRCFSDAGVDRLRKDLASHLKRAIFQFLSTIYVSSTKSCQRNKRKRVLIHDIEAAIRVNSRWII